MTLEQIGIIVTLVASGIAIVISISKFPFELFAADASAAKDYMETANNALDMAKEAQAEIAQLQTYILELKQNYAIRIAEMQAQIQKLQSDNYALTQQIKSLEIGNKILEDKLKEYGKS
jgi:hypothetical protein